MTKDFIDENGVEYSSDRMTLEKYPRDRKVPSFTIPDGVKSIQDYAFKGCESLKEIEIPETVDQIGCGAFEGCSSLISIKATGNPLFRSIDNVLFTTDMKILVKYPAAKEGISYKVPDGTESIGFQAFEGCQTLEAVYIPDSVRDIAGEAFDSCNKLRTINIPDTVESFGLSIFYDCPALKSVITPDGPKDKNEYNLIHY